jgi:hypothetical protein
MYLAIPRLRRERGYSAEDARQLFQRWRERRILLFPADPLATSYVPHSVSATELAVEGLAVLRVAAQDAVHHTAAAAALAVATARRLSRQFAHR